jgi:hypothetical protein
MNTNIIFVARFQRGTLDEIAEMQGEETKRFLLLSQEGSYHHLLVKQDLQLQLETEQDF